MLKKAVSTIALVTCYTAAAEAATMPVVKDFSFSPYIGAEYQYTHVNYENNILGTGIDGDDLAADSLHGANVHVGARVHKHLGFEAGYLWTNKANKSDILGSGLDSKVSVRGFNLDALGYLPVGGSEKVELIGTVGVSRLKASYSIPTVGSVNETETQPRFGAGVQVWLTDHVNVRGLVRYQGADFDDSVKNAVTANAGVNFQF
jgi:opacity protein-like surface antigen